MWMILPNRWQKSLKPSNTLNAWATAEQIYHQCPKNTEQSLGEAYKICLPGAELHSPSAVQMLFYGQPAPFHSVLRPTQPRVTVQANLTSMPDNWCGQSSSGQQFQYLRGLLANCAKSLGLKSDQFSRS